MAETEEEQKIRRALEAEADRKELADREAQEEQPREDPLTAIRRRTKK